MKLLLLLLFLFHSAESSTNKAERLNSPHSSIQGIVTSTQGLPIPGVTLYLDPKPERTRDLQAPPAKDLEWLTETNEEGRFKAMVPKESGAFRLELRKDGFLPERSTLLSVDAITQDFSEIEFRLEPSTFIEGVVIDSTGAPVRGAQVLWLDQKSGTDLMLGLEGVESVTDFEGRFHIRNLETGTGRLAAKAPGFSWAESPVQVLSADGLTDRVLPLEPATAVHGQLVDPEGQPIADATIRPIAVDVGSQRARDVLRQVNSTADGRFLLVDVPPGPVAFKIEHPDFESKDLRVGLEAERGHLVVELEPRPQSQILGLLLIENRPLWEEVTVRLTPTNRGNVASTSSDSSGTFRFEGIRPGHYLLTVEHPMWRIEGSQGKLLIDSPLEEITLSLVEGARIEGEIFGMDEGTARAIQLFTDAPGATNPELDPSTGRFIIDRIPTGSWTVTARISDSGKSISQPVRIDEPGETLFVRLELPETIEWSAVAFGPQGPLAGALIGVQTGEEGPWIWEECDLQGRATFRAVSPGPGQARVLLPSRGASLPQTIHQQRVSLRAGEDAILEVHPWTLQGTLLDRATRSPIVDVRLEIVSPGGDLLTYGRTDGRGHFEIRNVPAGDWFLLASKVGYAPERLAIGSNDAASPLELLLTPGEKP